MKNTDNDLKNKVFTILGTVISIILIPILIINVSLIIKSYTNSDEVPNLGGYFPLIVLTDSMNPEIVGGDLIICHTIEAEEIKTGDVISFFDPVGNGTSIVTHRVIEIINDSGEIEFRTRGDNNNAEDKTLVPAENVVGIYINRIGGLGKVALFMQSKTGFVVSVILPVLLLVGYDMIRRKNYESKNKKTNDELLAELELLRKEKAEREAKN